MSALVFAIQVLPVSGLALVATLVGASIPISGTLRIPLLLVGVLLFVGLMTFRRAHGWNLTLLLALAAVVGTLLHPGFYAERSLPWTGAIAIMILLLISAAFIGKALRKWFRRVGSALWLLAWVYLAGWMIGGLINPAEWLRILWASAGLVIFGWLVAVWFSQLSAQEIPPRGLAITQGCDLYLLGLSITAVGQVLLTSLVGP